ncbi:MAG: DUF1826 domain-containing protein [Pseudomonadota bacterium]
MHDTLDSAAIAMANSPEGLSAIHSPGCAAAIWSRRPLTSFQSWIDRVDPDRLPKTRTILRSEEVRLAATHVCELCGTPNCEERTRLIDDVSALADIFASLMDTSYLMLRLDVVSTNLCRKFHKDTITARLICTYRGTGTQYGFSFDQAEPQLVQTAPTGTPMIFRGNRWPEHPMSGLVHRSPPIEGSGQTRLILVLDPVTDPNEHAKEQFLH